MIILCKNQLDRIKTVGGINTFSATPSILGVARRLSSATPSILGVADTLILGALGAWNHTDRPTYIRRLGQSVLRLKSPWRNNDVRDVRVVGSARFYFSKLTSLGVSSLCHGTTRGVAHGKNPEVRARGSRERLIDVISPPLWRHCDVMGVLGTPTRGQTGLLYKYMAISWHYGVIPRP